MLGNKIIRKSNLQWENSHLISKKDGILRLCGDYRRLHFIAISNRYLTLGVKGFNLNVKGKNVFSKIDLFKAYFRIPITEENKPNAVIITQFGLFEFNIMSFRLRNTPSTFQKFIHQVFQDLEFTFIFLDDALIAFEAKEHFKHLNLVLERLEKCGLRINMLKSLLGMNDLEIL